jgi:hypothetical protein
MNPVELIKQHLGTAEWEQCKKSWLEPAIIKQADELSPFPTFKTYVVHGTTRQFDFPMLPHCSYAVYAANGFKAVRLTQTNKEIEKILAEEWSSLAACDPVVLARLVLKFYDGGIQASHDILRNVNDLTEIYKSDRGYVLNDGQYASTIDRVGSTEIQKQAEAVVLRVVTLRGWMHDKRNLGIERIHIIQSGRVSLERREVLSSKIFKSVPAIRY